MRVEDSVIGRITYPEELCFVFNVNRITIETNEDVSVQIGDINDVWQPFNGSVVIDISRYLQGLTSEKERQKDITVRLNTTSGGFSFSLRLVWGAINFDEAYNKEYTLRWWRGYPFTMELYIPEDVVSVKGRYDDTVYGVLDVGTGWVSIDPEALWPNAQKQAILRVEDGETSSIFDYTFDHSFTGVNKDSIHLYRLNVSEGCGCYLRWIDRHGWLRYWLFDKGLSTVSNKGNDAIEYIYMGLHEHRYKRQVGKTVMKSIKLCAPLVNDEELEMLEQLAGSPVVDMWTGSEWIPVIIEDMNVSKGGKDWKPLNDFECVMSYPEIVSQKL